MGLSNTIIVRTAAVAAAVLVVAIIVASTRAQEPSADPALIAAAQRAFKAIADGDVEALSPLVEKKYARKLTAAEFRPSQTGPKVAVAYDGKVRVLRTNGRSAVVQTTMFSPASTDIPKGEAGKLTLFMEKEKGEWVVDAPDRKEAAVDATLNGGWYHPGEFTFCPNRGLEFLGSHFSNKLNCQSPAVCR